MLRTMTARKQHRSGAEPETYGGHWAMFLPSVFVAVLYGGAWIALYAAGKGDTALAKLALLVLLLVVPLLAAIACLRYRSLRIEIGKEALDFRQGWLRPKNQRVKLGHISGAHAHWSPLGRSIGSGALSVKMEDATTYRIFDVGSPDKVAREINKRADRIRGNGD